MTKRVCATSGCHVLVEQGARNGRCKDCERSADKARGSRQQRGYAAAYDAIGRDYQRRMDEGERFRCWRCIAAGRHVKQLGARRGIDWVLGHCDVNRSVIHGPECPPCNYATAGRRDCPHPTHAA